MAVALGVEAVKAGKSVYFATLADLATSMQKAERDGSLRERVRYLSRHSLLLVDENGYLPVGSSGGNLFFQMVRLAMSGSRDDPHLQSRLQRVGRDLR